MRSKRYEYEFDFDQDFRGELDPGYREIREVLKELGLEEQA